MKHPDALDQLAELFVDRGVPQYIRSDNGSEFTAGAAQGWLKAVGVKTLYLELGSPWEDGYVESFNGKLRDELLNREEFITLREVQVLIERWRESITSGGLTAPWHTVLQHRRSLCPGRRLGIHPHGLDSRSFRL